MDRCSISPGRQVVALDCQVIMATHSPILQAFPGAAIWTFDESPIRSVAYADLGPRPPDRDFLNNPDAYLRHL